MLTVTIFQEYGKRGRSSVNPEGIIVNTPLLVEVINKQSKLEPLSPQMKRMVATTAPNTLDIIRPLFLATDSNVVPNAAQQITTSAIDVGNVRA
ncbi:MAG: hypothetical protein ACR2IS_04865 [Nitrososphaeraceae archaeon]